jgi:peptide/nickel transport system substrate-binding protein
VAEQTVKPGVGEETEGPQYGGVLPFCIFGSPITFEPNSYYGGFTEVIMSTWLERLWFGDWAAPRDKVKFLTYYLPFEYTKGWLAESWENPDPQTYIVHLRKGIHFQNKEPVFGRELVAQDVVYSYNRHKGKIEGTPASAMATLVGIREVTSLEAKDKYTVVMHLSTPFPMFPEYLGTLRGITIVPHEVVDKYGSFTNWRNAVGTGPFILEDYVADSVVLFTKNPNYWGYDERYPDKRLPYVDKIKYLIIPDYSTRLAALRTGKVGINTHAFGAVAWQEALDLQKTNPELQWARYPQDAPALDVRNDMAPFTDRRVRKALQMAIDLKGIAATYFSGNADPFPSIFSPAMGSLYTPLEQYPDEVQEAFTYNPEKAKKLLAEAGYPQGFKTNLVIASGSEVPMAEIAKEYWAKISVDLQIKVLEPAVSSTILYGRKYDQIAWLRTGMSYAPTTSLNYFYGGTSVAWNFANANDPTYNKMLDTVYVTPDAKERARLMKEANVYGTSQFFVIGLPIRFAYNFWQPWVKGYSGESNLGMYNEGCIYARVWIDQQLRQKMGH